MIILTPEGKKMVEEKLKTAKVHLSNDDIDWKDQLSIHQSEFKNKTTSQQCLYHKISELQRGKTSGEQKGKKYTKRILRHQISQQQHWKLQRALS